ncbi:MAG: hypothetical protein AAFP04_00880 [Myxococcota bacterium]
MVHDREDFGDPRYTSDDLLPTPDDQRVLDHGPAFALWATLVLHPVVVDRAMAGSSLELRGLLPVVFGSAMIALVGFALLRTPQRYGLGFTATARAAFGVRGAHSVVVLRWLASVVWAGAWVGHISDWGGRLLLALLKRFAVLPDALLSRAREPALLVLAVLLVLVAARPARRGMEDFAARAFPRLVIALTVGVALVSFAVWRNRGLPTPVFGLSGYGIEQGVSESMAIGLATLPALLSFAEWARLRVRAGVDPQTGRRRDRRARAMAPFVLVPSAVTFSLLGGLIHAAAASSSGVAPRGLVASASAFGGALGGAAAVVLGLLLFFSLVPFAGIEAPLRGLNTVMNSTSQRWPRIITAVGIVGVSAVVKQIEPAVLMVAAGVLVLPLTVVLIVDDGLIRRGRLTLESLYEAPSIYGRFFGLGLAGCAAVLLGMTLSVARWDGFRFLGFPKITNVLAHLNGWVYGGGALVAIGIGVVVAIVFASLRVLESLLPLIPTPALRGPGPERIVSAASSVDLSVQAAEPNLIEWDRVEKRPVKLEPGDSTAADISGARYAANVNLDDEWPDESEESRVEWFDSADEMSNPSMTALGDPRFIKKNDDDGA